MTLTCYFCSTPLFITRDTIDKSNAAATDTTPAGPPIHCPACGAQYRVDVKVVKEPSPAVQKLLADEKRGRVVVTRPDGIAVNGGGAAKGAAAK